jgi:hypothetical protein
MHSPGYITVRTDLYALVQQVTLQHIEDERIL